MQGALAELVHPLIYTQESVWRLVTLFSSSALRLCERTLMWIWVAVRQRTRCSLRRSNPPQRRTKGGIKLQDESMVDELIENLYSLAKRGEVPQFFLRSIARFRRSEMQRRMDQPKQRTGSASGGMTGRREATRLRGHSSRAHRILR